MKSLIPKEHKGCYACVSQKEILVKLFALPFIREGFFLTGGTCLSVFYLGHRISKDLDLFLVTESNLLNYAGFFRGISEIEYVVGETHFKISMPKPQKEKRSLRTGCMFGDCSRLW